MTAQAFLGGCDMKLLIAVLIALSLVIELADQSEPRMPFNASGWATETSGCCRW